ncbi:MAG: S8 family serine peptidase [Phycisphaerales bacterium]|nr:S8 family serine peptidase [Hyphomonadaceae bacterium]
MARKISRVLAFSVLALSLAASVASSQEPPQGVYFRSTGAEAPRVDRYIAEHARPVEFGAQVREALETMTPEEIIVVVCGSVRSGHYDVFASRPENAGLRRHVAIGDRAQTIVIPACLYVDIVSSEELRVASGGEAPSVEAVRGEQPARGFNPLAPLLNPARTIRYLGRSVSGQQILTVPTFLQPQTMPLSEFIEGVENEAQRGSVVREASPGEGEIILGVEQGEVASGGVCEAGPPSFTPQAVLAFYRFARARGAERIEGPVDGGPVEIVIVDNGFYGARRDLPWEEAWAGSPFPRNLFRSSGGTVASRLRADRGHPLNDGDPDVRSGHGTHVTGLAIGGPELSPEIFDPNGSGRSWLTVTIYNVSNNGSRIIDADTQRDLAHALRLVSVPRRRVVNMSIAFAGVNELAPIYRLMSSDSEDDRVRDLFVVAAGNTTSSNLDRDVGARAIYPASLGGLARTNVLTVAAHDAAFQLAEFSNYSSHSVDIAAPGCAIRSWIGRERIEPMSGTSMATPLVTYTAALVASLVETMTSEEIKRRIVVSGDLLEPPAADNIAFRVRLNTLRSVLLFDDIVELADAPGVFVGGDIEMISGIRCRGAAFDAGLLDLWSFKRGASGAYLYRGRRTEVVTTCPATASADAAVTFRERFRIARDGTYRAATHDPRPIPLSEVTSIVQRAPIR